MRPAGEVHQALLAAAQQGPATLRELAQRSQVGWDVARYTVGNMARRGVLRVVGAEHVAYRNRLVQVYEAATPVVEPDPAAVDVHADVQADADACTSGPGWVSLSACVQGWGG